jgi:DNA-binding IclR family transcriptional regulator
MESEADAATPSVKSAERTLSILERLARAGEPLSFSTIRRDLDIPKSSLHALLATMVARGWLASDASGTRFGLGHRARLLDDAAVMDPDLLMRADDVLEDLRDQLDETIHLACLDGPEILYLSSKYSRHALNVRFHAGRRLPAHVTALGKAMLALLPPEQLRHHLPEHYEALTAHTITTEAGLLTELELVRAQGFAVDSEESAVGLRCFATGIRHPRIPLHAISCSSPTARLSRSKEDAIVAALRRSQRKLMTRLGPV